jgi:hypothetical protein
MPTPKLNIIQPSLGFVRLSDADLLQRLNAVYDGMLNNPSFSDPPIGMPEFKAGIDAFTSAVTAMLLKGGKSATAERDKRRNDAIVMLRRLGHYVEGACKNDLTTFISSGFVALSVAHKIPQPLPPPSGIRVDQGDRGQLIVRINPVPGARAYQLRYAAVAAAGVEADWTTIQTASTKPPIAVNNLIRGTTYWFEARVMGQLGLSDWSGPAERMCI